jgi:hypothetical protein
VRQVPSAACWYRAIAEGRPRAPSSRNHVAFGHDVIDLNRDLGERVAVSGMKCLEARRPVQIGAKTMDHSVSGKHLVNGFRTPFGPHLFKPATKESFVFG